MVVTCRRNGERGAAPVPACPLRLRKGGRPCPCAPPAAAQGWPTAPFGLAQGWQSRPCAPRAGGRSPPRPGARVGARPGGCGAAARPVRLDQTPKLLALLLEVVHAVVLPEEIVVLLAELLEHWMPIESSGQVREVDACRSANVEIQDKTLSEFEQDAW